MNETDQNPRGDESDESDPIAKFVARFPRLFHGKFPRVMSSLPHGWIDVVTRLFVDLDALLDDAQARRLEIIQVKEKFAGLCVYWSLGKEKTSVIDILGEDSVQRLRTYPRKPSDVFAQITARVGQAEDEAARTCQRCGNGGATRNQTGGWLVTLCEPCRASGSQDQDQDRT